MRVVTFSQICKSRFSQICKKGVLTDTSRKNEFPSCLCKHESPVDLFSKILVCVSLLHPKQADDFELLTILCWALAMVLSNHKLCFYPSQHLQASVPVREKLRFFAKSPPKIFLDMFEHTQLGFVGRELHRLSSPRGKNLLLLMILGRIRP